MSSEGDSSDSFASRHWFSKPPETLFLIESFRAGVWAFLRAVQRAAGLGYMSRESWKVSTYPDHESSFLTGSCYPFRNSRHGITWVPSWSVGRYSAHDDLRRHFPRIPHPQRASGRRKHIRAELKDGSNLQNILKTSSERHQMTWCSTSQPPCTSAIPQHSS